MKKRNTKTTLHPQFLERLFRDQVTVGRVFRDVLGLYEIAHIAVSHINQQNELLTFSSTPSLEFNLFSTYLWQFDKTYQRSWFQLCTQAPWEALYTNYHYDELYHLKQSKPHYPIGFSIAFKLPSSHIIYSIASQSNNRNTQDIFTHQQDKLLKIALYCSNALLPLFCHSDAPVSHHPVQKTIELKSDNKLKYRIDLQRVVT